GASPSPTLPRRRGRGSTRPAHLTCDCRGLDSHSPARPSANERVRAANRANAARSTGPRTRAGKQRSARNALRHGLNQPVLADPGRAAEAADLARRIAGEDATEPHRAAALRIAEAQVDIQRIRRVREQIMVEGFAAAGDITARLMRLDRYERRALSRRKSAILAFDSLERPAAPPRRRNPWAAVAAYARLRGPVRRSPTGEGGLWRNEPGVGGTRGAWGTVAAARRPGGAGRPAPRARAEFGRTNPISAGHAFRALPLPPPVAAHLSAEAQRAKAEPGRTKPMSPARLRACVPRPIVPVRLSFAPMTDRTRILDFS